jgi:hypothetical protein
MDVTRLAYDAGKSAAMEFVSMSMTLASMTSGLSAIRMLTAAAAAMTTKAPGAAARVIDARQADLALKTNTIKGELLTLGQVGTYASIIDAFVTVLQTKSSKVAALTKNRALLLVALSFMANCIAETLSRTVYKRTIHGDGAAAVESRSVLGKRKREDDDHDDGKDHRKVRPRLSVNPFASQPLLQEPIVFAQKNQQATPYSVSPCLLSVPVAVRQAPFQI